MKKTLVLLTLAALVSVGCSALKSFVKTAEGNLNAIMDGTHGIVTNSVETATAPLK